MTGLSDSFRRQHALPVRLGRMLKAVPWPRFLLLAGSTLAVFFLCVASITPVRYDLSVGMVPSATIVANKDVVDEVTTAQNREAAAASVTPSYKYQEGVAERVMQRLTGIEEEFADIRRYVQGLPNPGPGRRYSKEELKQARTFHPLEFLADYQLETLMNAPPEPYEEMLVSLNAAVRNAMRGNVTQGQENLAVSSVLQVVGFRTEILLLQNLVLPVLHQVIEPNMVIDQAGTEAARQAAREAVEPVVFKRGQNIVVRGEGRIRENQIAMLNSLGLLRRNEIDYSMYLGTLMLVLMVTASLNMGLKAASPRIHESLRDLSVLYSLLVVVLGLGMAAKTVHAPFLAPTALAPMLAIGLTGCFPASLLLNGAVSVFSALLLGGPGSGTSADMVSVLVTALVSGSAAALLLRKNQQRPYVLAAGLAASAVSFAAGLGIALIMSSDPGYIWDRVRYIPAGGLASGLLCIALQPAYETLFNLPTPSRLMDLSNPNRPLLRRLLTEAPGTYHHSIIIANLAEAAAEAVGANALLARTAAYYHDVGKLKRPLYFKENQIGAGNVHDRTDPQVSAAIITAHVRDGAALARQYRLPREIRRIIEQHHGDSLVSYFYSKALNESSDPNIDGSEFRYEGVPPETAEAAILMICDTIEAAVRSLSSPSPEEIDRFIGRLIEGKINEGQLRNAPLTLRDLDRIQKACARVIHGVFHERIEYPETHSRLPFRRQRPTQISAATSESAASAPGAADRRQKPAPAADAPVSVSLRGSLAVPESSREMPSEPSVLPLPEVPGPAGLRIVRPEEFSDRGSIRIVEPPRPSRPITVEEMVLPPGKVNGVGTVKKTEETENRRGDA